MLIPPRCFTCGNPIGDKWGYFVDTMIEKKNASKEKKSLLRKQLYQTLELNYEALRKMGVKLMIFVEPNNKTFLRMHKPDIFGDDVSKVRKAIALVNQTKEIQHGLEAGKISHAFRHIYPIHNKAGDYLGCVDISFSSESIQQVLDDVHKLHTHFLIDKQTLDKRVWEIKNLSSRFIPAFENDSI